MYKKKSIPDIITDNGSNNLKLAKEQYLGKGASGKCYSLRCTLTGKMYAGKCFYKKEIEKYNITDKIIQEINIHKSLNHENIVGFHSCIEDKKFIYIILELCSNRSMSELIRRRKCILVFEAKYFMKQVVSAVSYLHQKKIIHRDIKLANLFINCNMVIKLGDFGLAVRASDDISNRRSLCGTPNYIAPEVLSRKGHSYEVDIWALGCILYTYLVGKPPFQSNTVEETYSLITKCQYSLPQWMKNSNASSFIRCALQKDSKSRPSINKLSEHDFLKTGYIPNRLPPSCMVMAPRTKSLLHYNRENNHSTSQDASSILKMSHSGKDKLTDLALLEKLRNLNYKIKRILSDILINENTDDSQNPSLRPFIWINSWSYDSNTNAFGYRLNDNSVGTLFNDNTTLLALTSGKCVYYFQKDGSESFYKLENIKTFELCKKLELLKKFRTFMFNSLKKAYEDYDMDAEPLSSFPILKSWANEDNIVAMYLSNGTLQLNFLHDHNKLILCPELDSVTVITNCNRFSTFQLDLVKKYGCDKLLAAKLNGAIKAIEKITVSFFKTWIMT